MRWTLGIEPGFPFLVTSTFTHQAILMLVSLAFAQKPQLLENIKQHTYVPFISVCQPDGCFPAVQKVIQVSIYPIDFTVLSKQRTQAPEEWQNNQRRSLELSCMDCKEQTLPRTLELCPANDLAVWKAQLGRLEDQRSDGRRCPPRAASGFRPWLVLNTSPLHSRSCRCPWEDEDEDEGGQQGLKVWKPDSTHRTVVPMVPACLECSRWQECIFPPMNKQQKLSS